MYQNTRSRAASMVRETDTEPTDQTNKKTNRYEPKYNKDCKGELQTNEKPNIDNN